jgi:hypothetical protein
VTRRIASILLVAAMSLASAAPALAGQRDINAVILAQYIKGGGRLDACKFTPNQLKTAKDSIPEDLKQYGASLIAAIDDAIATQAQGGCNKAKQHTAAAPAATTPPPSSGQPTPPPASSSHAATQAPAAPAKAQAPPTPTAEPTPVAQIATDDAIPLAAHTTAVVTDPPVPLIVLAILASLLALSALLFGVVRWLAWEPAWSVRLRHATGEAGWRAAGTWADFSDFVRLGR